MAVNISEVQDQLSWQYRLPDLLELLREMKVTGKRLPDRLRGLAFLLQKHGFLKSNDVKLIDSWIQVGRFPPLYRLVASPQDTAWSVPSGIRVGGFLLGYCWWVSPGIRLAGFPPGYGLVGSLRDTAWWVPSGIRLGRFPPGYCLVGSLRDTAWSVPSGIWLGGFPLGYGWWVPTGILQLGGSHPGYGLVGTLRDTGWSVPGSFLLPKFAFPLSVGFAHMGFRVFDTHFYLAIRVWVAESGQVCVPMACLNVIRVAHMLGFGHTRGGCTA
jgi:hypothetical protein